jgi:hypothetical protein
MKERGIKMRRFPLYLCSDGRPKLQGTRQQRLVPVEQMDGMPGQTLHRLPSGRVEDE